MNGFIKLTKSLNKDLEVVEEPNKIKLYFPGIVLTNDWDMISEEIIMVKDEHGNNIVFYDPLCQEEMAIEKCQVQNIELMLEEAMDNLNGLYQMAGFEFNEIDENLGLYQFYSDIYCGQVMTVLLLKKVQDTIESIIGENGCIISTVFGDLYVLSGKKSLDREIRTMLNDIQGTSEYGYTKILVRNGLVATEYLG